MFDGLLADLEEGLSTSVIAARFHNTVVGVIEAMAQNATQESGIKKVVLSGGSFQNRILVERSVDVLQSAGYEVYIQHKVPCNDGGIALGQLAVAAAKSRRP
jgi:hydrogenase maturation protein HypF